MKQKLFILFAFLFIGISSKVQAYDFSSIAPSGQTLYYNIISSTAPYKVEVTSQNTSYPLYTTEPVGAITIPDSLTNNGTTYFVTSIGDFAFTGCSSLTSVTIPNSVTYIGKSAFSNCSILTAVTIPNSVTYIGKSAFSNCCILTAVTIPNSVTSIDEFAFYNCSSLTLINVDANNALYSSIDGVLFNKNADTLIFYPGGKNINYFIPNSVTSIGNFAFSGCSGLPSVIIPNSVTSIGIGAFSNCSGLTSITIGNSVTYIWGSAFYGCSSLTSITIPKSVIFINLGVIDGCVGLTLINVDTNNTKYSSKDGVLFNKNADTLIIYPRGGNGNYLIPNTVTLIGIAAFSGCNGLTSVTIPNSVISISIDAFYNCSGLTSITIPNSVTSIGDYAFHGCTGLTSITSKSINPPFISSDSFSGVSHTFSEVDNSIPVYVPIGSKIKYQSNEYWGYFTNFIEVSSGLAESINFNDKNIRLYPNPTSTKIVLEIQAINEGADIAIYDLSGRIVGNCNLAGGQKQLEINVEEYAKGVYYIKISNNNNSFTKKFIVE